MGPVYFSLAVFIWHNQAAYGSSQNIIAINGVSILHTSSCVSQGKYVLKPTLAGLRLVLVSLLYAVIKLFPWAKHYKTSEKNVSFTI